jgi:integrase
VRHFLSTPVYSGHHGRFLRQPGRDLAREGQYWSGLIGLYSGARAGEIAQLLTTDFHFDGPVPYISFGVKDSQGRRTKTIKNRASIRDVPIAPVLLELGLEQWVGRRKSVWGEAPVFREIKTGASGNMSDGMSKWWGRHFREHGLWKPGRGPHVWRHTLIDILRDAGVPKELIDAIVGHKDRSMNAGYGRGFGLERKLEAMSKIDFGFDVVAELRSHEAKLVRDR